MNHFQMQAANQFFQSVLMYWCLPTLKATVFLCQFIHASMHATLYIKVYSLFSLFLKIILMINRVVFFHNIFVTSKCSLIYITIKNQSTYTSTHTKNLIFLFIKGQWIYINECMYIWGKAIITYRLDPFKSWWRF